MPIINSITEALAKGGKVEIRDFGVFQVVIRKVRIGHNLTKNWHTDSRPCYGEI